ncbi:hypothetical protein [Nonomuraea sp. NPDC049028]
MTNAEIQARLATLNRLMARTGGLAVATSSCTLPTCKQCAQGEIRQSR